MSTIANIKLRLTLTTFIIILSCGFAISETFTHNSTWNSTIFAKKQYHRVMFEESPIPQAIVGSSGSFWSVNGALCNAVGYSDSELTTKTFQEITHPDDIKMDIDMMKKVMSGYIQRYTMKKRYIGKWNRIIHITLHVQGIFDDDDGTFSHFYVIVIPREPQGSFTTSMKTETIPKSGNAVEFFKNEWRTLIPWGIILYFFMVKIGMDWRLIKKSLKTKEDKSDEETTS